MHAIHKTRVLNIHIFFILQGVEAIKCSVKLGESRLYEYIYKFICSKVINKYPESILKRANSAQLKKRSWK